MIEWILFLGISLVMRRKLRREELPLMKHSLLFLALTVLSLNSSAELPDDTEFISRLFKVLPESHSLRSYSSAPARMLPQRLKAVVWNIKKAERTAWKQEFDRYAEGRDLFLLQEVYERPVFLDTISSMVGHQWEMGISFLYRQYGNAATGSMIGAAATPLEASVKHSPDREPLTLTPKATTVAKYDVEALDTDLLVISVHGINFESTEAFRRQMRQVEGEVRKHRGPVLLAGDFNTWNEGRTSSLHSLVRRLGLSEAAYTNGQERMTFNGWPLDHVFTRELVVHSATVEGGSVGSDHRPILLDLEVATRARLRR